MAFIIIADADPGLGSLLQQEFQRQGHQVLVVRSGQDALRLAERYHPDLVVLNAMLPQCSALEVHQRLKATLSLYHTQVLFYCMQLRVEEEPANLARGTDAYAHRPSPLHELIARGNSLLRQGNATPAPTPSDHLIAGALILHCHNMTVERDGRVCMLTPTEFELLRYLMLHANETCSATRLLQHVWGYPPGVGSTDLVRAYIRSLRCKIEECPARPVYLRTVRHRGYVFCSQGDGDNDKRWILEQTAKESASPAVEAIGL
ncbi:MAG: response regulator transcription factor [Chloroflexi bacterium]|nr:response regulator transcription factor [Chloroflexota bacterium]